MTRQEQGAPADEERRLAFTRCAAPELATLYRAAAALTEQPADAEDLVQETLLRAFRAWDSFDGSHPRAWLLTIMRHAAANQRRRRSPRLLGDAIEPQLRADAVYRQVMGPEEMVVAGSFCEAVTAALRRLPERSQVLVRLVDVQGLSIGQAALLAGMNEGAARSRLHRARAQMRARLTASAVPAPGGRR